MTTIHAYDAVTHQPIKVTVDGAIIAAIELAERPEQDSYISPAFWDIQTNGRWGISFSDPTITVDQVVEIVRAHAALGTARLLPTLITTPHDAMIHGVRTIAQACVRFPEIARMIIGIHLEGPAISELDGYRGAHPVEAVRDPSIEEFHRLQKASGGRIKLITLAPERAGAIDFIEHVTSDEVGIIVALGHTAADVSQINAAVRAGATLSTHLGNGIESILPRHPNPIWHQAADDRLMASLIADGDHLDPATLKVLTRAKGLHRVILISDFSPLAGLEPGIYGAWQVEPSGRIAVAGTPYLAGANRDLLRGLWNLKTSLGVSLGQVIPTVTTNPACLMRAEEPRLEVGHCANLAHFTWSMDVNEPGAKLITTWVDGVCYCPESLVR